MIPRKILAIGKSKFQSSLKPTVSFEINQDQCEEVNKEKK